MSNEKDNKNEKQSNGFFSKLRSFVVEDVPENNEETSKKKTATETDVLSSMPSSFNFSNNVNPLQAAGAFDPEMYKDLQATLDKNNLEGYDYHEFSKIRKRQETIPNIPEPQKYVMAYESIQAMAQVSGQEITKEHIISTADHYIDVLSKEEVKFNSDVASAIEKKVQTRYDAAKQKEATIASKAEQIAQLQKEIEDLKVGINEDLNTAEQEKNKIEFAAKNFKITLDLTKGEIERDKQNITTFIK